MADNNYKSLLSKHELEPLLEKSDTRAWWGVLVNYLLIAVAFALPIWWLNVWMVFLSLILLGNRQLGLGILMHDCAHHALFRRTALNRWVGTNLCAAPILAQYEGYRTYHLKHHAKAGTTDDPDYPNYKPYPIAPASLRRKIVRDVLGITGVKNLLAIVVMHAGCVDFDMSYKSKNEARAMSKTKILLNLWRNLYRSLIGHGLLFAVLWALQAPWLYLLWWVAFLTTFQLFSRIRNAAEHANVPDLLSKDPRLHARTTYARWWEKLTVAPNHVNYHLEHHWIASVPPYNLARFHRLLKDKQLLADAQVLSGYGQVIKTMVAVPA